MKDDCNNSGPRRIAEAASSAKAHRRSQAHPPCWTLLAPHPDLKTWCELDKNLNTAHKPTEKISGEEEQMIVHHGYFLRAY